MNLYMLDTNIASHLIKGDIALVRERLLAVPIHRVVISSVTLAELRYGLAKRSYPKGLTTRVHEFLIRVKILSWDKDAANVYGDLRSRCESAGLTLSPFDLMIAAHAQAPNAILVTSDIALSAQHDSRWLDGRELDKMMRRIFLSTSNWLSFSCSYPLSLHQNTLTYNCSVFLNDTYCCTQ